MLHCLNAQREVEREGERCRRERHIETQKDTERNTEEDTNRPRHRQRKNGNAKKKEIQRIRGHHSGYIYRNAETKRNEDGEMTMLDSRGAG